MFNVNEIRTGIRTYLYTLPDGTQVLLVGVVVNGEELLRVPGSWVARLRGLLQLVEKEHPTLTGTDAGIEEVEKVEVLSGRSDPSKAHLN